MVTGVENANKCAKLVAGAGDQEAPMMQRIRTRARDIALGLLVGAGLAMGPAALAQDPVGPAAPPLVTVAPGCEVAGDEPLALCVHETIVNSAGQFAGARVYLQVADEGWTRYTPCDDVIVRCQDRYIRAEGVNQGDVFTLAGGS